jgi:hypothetical protein
MTMAFPFGFGYCLTLGSTNISFLLGLKPLESGLQAPKGCFMGANPPVLGLVVLEHFLPKSSSSAKSNFFFFFV